MVTPNIWHARECHKGHNFPHCWVLGQIGVRCHAEKSTRNKLSLVVPCWLPTVCGAPTYSSCKPFLYDVGEVSILETFGKLTAGCRPPSESHHRGSVAAQSDVFGDLMWLRTSPPWSHNANNPEEDASTPPCFLARVELWVFSFVYQWSLLHTHNKRQGLFLYLCNNDSITVVWQKTLVTTNLQYVFSYIFG